mmetsp:Transcript_8432/g.35247  ORF Transcript_8432/g.35247 Transcript_8432/m.35247 type:complete len:116 (-) Transcript_8432:561-908(-)
MQTLPNCRDREILIGVLWNVDHQFRLAGAGVTTTAMFDKRPMKDFLLPGTCILSAAPGISPTGVIKHQRKLPLAFAKFELRTFGDAKAHAVINFTDNGSSYHTNFSVTVERHSSS